MKDSPRYKGTAQLDKNIFVAIQLLYFPRPVKKDSVGHKKEVYITKHIVQYCVRFSTSIHVIINLFT